MTDLSEHFNDADGLLKQALRVSTSWRVPREMHGLRVDQFLQRHIGRISRERAQRIILTRDFLLDEREVKPSMRVRAGQRATLIRFAPDKSEDIADFDVGIVYEDADLLVVNKPAGLSIHPTANCLYKTLTHWLRTQFPGAKINPCHRIDKETSGLVVCAKNRQSEALVKRAFMTGAIAKSYLAVVEGLLEEPRTITIPIGLQKSRGLVAIRMIEDREGKEAKTLVMPLMRDQVAHHSLVLCHPKTGRQHQIRAHLSLIGHPLVGDKLYGKPDEFFDRLTRGFDDGLLELGHKRHALHAARLRMSFKGKRHVFRAPFPRDLADLIGTP
jgi:23S rRNA pseudouridine1911/1915/1917 synthase